MFETNTMNSTRTLQRSKLTLGLIAALAAAPVFAQSTSAGVGGQVVGGNGQPVAGVEVTITHIESGSVSRAVTDGNGRYVARGLRVGGPYTISVSHNGQSDTEENVYLALDTTNNVNLDIAAAAAGSTLDTITVVGTAMANVFTPDSTGAATIIGRQEIEALPSVRRSLEDYVRLDPRIVQVDKERGGISASGQNNRYNNIRIDGVPTNDNFGLNDSGMPALNQPIVMDWIQEFNVSISNYDVTQGDFVGANVNAVTKSGTNDFHGAVYGTYRDSDMIGKKVAGRERPSPFKRETNWGGYLGGPLVKDRLFFFAGYEKFRRDAEAVSTGVAGSGATNEFRLTQAELDAVTARAAALGASAGSIGSFAPINNIANTDSKVIVKLDWNINDDHRASLRYNKTDGSVLRQNNSSNTLQASSNRFQDNITFENWAAMLYSNWGDSFSSELNVSYSEYRSTPTSFSSTPQVTIRVPGISPSGNEGTIAFGQERSRQANRLSVDTWTAFAAANWYVGDHELKFGVDYESSDIYNLFLQDAVGSYEFTGNDALGNFLSGKGARYRYQRARTGNNHDAASRFKVGNLGLFVQDTWTVNERLTLIYGLRADQTRVSGTPAFNAGFLADFGIDNRNTPDGKWTVAPRVGFNYTFDTDGLTTQFRGGIGLFMGSAPGVWLSNSFSNAGVLVDSYDIRNAGMGAGSLDPNNPYVPANATAAQYVNAMANDFRQPTVWKANFGIDQQLPWWGLTGGVEFLAARTERGVNYVNYALGDANGTLPDGRAHYWADLNGSRSRIRANCLLVDPTQAFNSSRNPCRYTNAIVLENTRRGSSQNVTFSLEKPWADGWFGKLAFTWGRSTEVSPGTSSVALSNWQNRSVLNQNEDMANRSNYEIDRRVTLALSKKFNFFGERAPTRFSMFYEGRHGRPYSYVFKNDANGDGVRGNDLFFVPGSAADVSFTANSSAEDQAVFWNYLANDKYLKGMAGVLPRNYGRSPWRNVIDVRIQQDIPLGMSGLKAEVFLDIENFGNLLNKKWGQVEEAGFPYTMGVVDYAGVKDGKYVYDVSSFHNEATGRSSTPYMPYRNLESRWMAQVGFRLTF
ncbi:Oar protein [Lysobacteraceae bacterium NML03-0222]|nr:Oar protein [Xanthomonadaceae bacterium NML03-0222]